MFCVFLAAEQLVFVNKTTVAVARVTPLVSKGRYGNLAAALLKKQSKTSR